MSERNDLTCPNCKGNVIDWDGITGACFTCGTEFNSDSEAIIRCDICGSLKQNNDELQSHLTNAHGEV